MQRDKDYAARRYIGQRERQEDDVAFFDGVSGHLLAVLADGMGGHAGGEIASRTAVNEVIAYRIAYSGSASSFSLKKALHHANGAILNIRKKEKKLDGMGCTLVIASICADGLRWVSIGDSSLYLFRDNTLQKLNEDHSLGAALDAQVERGEIAPEEAMDNSRRNALLHALTGDTVEHIDDHANHFALQAGDIILICSDGLDTLRPEEIQTILTQHHTSDASNIAQKLEQTVIDKALPNQDNTSICTICISEGPVAPAPHKTLQSCEKTAITKVLFAALLLIITMIAAQLT